jgi:hypothetical protein
MVGTRGREDGAVAVVVAVFVASIAVILLAFATDIGSLWQSQRALVTDTDAAALAGAIELAEDWMASDECSPGLAEAEARSVLLTNNSTDEVISTAADCSIDGAAFTGWVRMTARQPSPGFVSGAELSAGGTSTATFQLMLGEAQGLAVCTNLFGGPDQVNANFEITRNGQTYLLLPYKFAEQTLNNEGFGPQCTVAPSINGSPNTAGGWGWLDSPCEISVDGNDAPVPSWCEADTGTDNLKKSFADQVGSVVEFPIYERARGVGTRAEYLIVGLARATLIGACGSGNGPFLPEDCSPNGAGNWARLQGQPGFIVVSEPRAFYFNRPEAPMFSEATYSICDVDGSDRFCPTPTG